MRYAIKVTREAIQSNLFSPLSEAVLLERESSELREAAVDTTWSAGTPACLCIAQYSTCIV